MKDYFKKADKMIEQAKDVERLRKILGVIQISGNLSPIEKDKLVSSIEVKRNYLSFNLFSDYLKP